MTSWVSALGTETHVVLADVLRRCGAVEHPELLHELGAKPAARRVKGQTSRQARHARLSRARSTAAAGALLLSFSDDELLRLVLGAELTHLRPFTADVSNRFFTLAHLADGVTPARVEAVFERAASVFVDVGRRVEGASDEEALRIHSATSLMMTVVLLAPERARSWWRQLRDEAEQQRLDDSPYLGYVLAVVGTQVGEPEALLEWLLHGGSREREVAGAFCFVRRDTLPDVYATEAAVIRGGPVRSTTALYPPRPASTVKHLADHVLTCMRSAPRFQNVGHILQLLTWVEDVKLHLRRLSKERGADVEVAAIKERLRRIERVQVMEKRRFWEAYDQLPDGELKRRLEELWRHPRTLSR